MGTRYRTLLLSHGGETPAAELVENMLQEPPTTSMLVGAMVDDLVQQVEDFQSHIS